MPHFLSFLNPTLTVNNVKKNNALSFFLAPWICIKNTVSFVLKKKPFPQQQHQQRKRYENKIIWLENINYVYIGIQS
jgi:hypothetical protein